MESFLKMLLTPSLSPPYLMMESFLKMLLTPSLSPPYLMMESFLKMLLTPSLSSSLPDDGELPQDAPHPQPITLLT